MASCVMEQLNPLQIALLVALSLSAIYLAYGSSLITLTYFATVAILHPLAILMWAGTSNSLYFEVDFANDIGNRQNESIPYLGDDIGSHYRTCGGCLYCELQWMEEP